MNYRVITTNNSQVYMAISELENTVKGLLRDGWKPQGGINIIYVQHSNLFFVSQAVVK